MAKQSKRARVKELVLEMFEAHYPGDLDDPLEIDPNDFDLDPCPFYETLSSTFGVPFDDEESNFGGFGGTLGETIAYIAARWDGELREPEHGDEDEDLDED
jgi:hypothetical protein